ncbi:hypothetical protein [Streptomyces sp. NPDC006739]|uniref:hypothetical protein n=1 Tax=Streptomyces sp. NPDC006739 TaxID=3364763 RepID=UPI00367F3EEA
MPHPVVSARVGAATAAQSAGIVPRTADPAPRPQWQGLFREPDWPSEDEPEA